MKLNDTLMYDFIKNLEQIEQHYAPFVSEAAETYKFSPEPVGEPDPELEYSREEEMEQRDVPIAKDYHFRPSPVQEPIQGPPEPMSEPDPELEYSREEEMEQRDVPHDPEQYIGEKQVLDLIVRNPLHAILNLKLYQEPQYRKHVYAMVKSLMALIEVNPGKYLEDRAEEINTAFQEMLTMLEQDVEKLEEKKKMKGGPVETGASDWSPVDTETGTSEWKI